MFGFRPRDAERYGYIFCIVNLVFLGLIWPLFEFFCEDVVVKDGELRGMWYLQRMYRILLYFIALYWLVRKCRKYDVKTLLFLKVDSFYVSRVAKAKGLGGLWVYTAIIQNFGLELMCLFAPYFVVIVISRALSFFYEEYDLYSISFHIGGHTIDKTSPVAYRIVLYLLGILSMSYSQIVFLLPCVYFRMVSSLILLEMKAYKSMVQPERKEDDDDLTALTTEEIPISNPLGAGPEVNANSFMGGGDINMRMGTSSDGLGDISEATPTVGGTGMGTGEVSSPIGNDLGSEYSSPVEPSPSVYHSAKATRVYQRYGSNPFGMYINDQNEEDDGFDGIVEDLGDPSLNAKAFPVLREHSLLQNVLKLISHRFRQFLLISFILIFFESFGTLYFLMNDMLYPKSSSRYSFFGILVRIEMSSSAFLHVVGLVLNVRAILIMTHRLRAVHSIASEQHAHLTCRMNLACLNLGQSGDGASREMSRQCEQYMKRQALLQYMEDHPLGITIYGFLIDREFLRSFHMVVVSLTVFLVSLVIGSRGKA
mmetsp:Transcript_10346/g.26254  ORF Transcript_10346/g.26254 Transcript_10346/m.26254 type:complete len:538 (+) Transcript_10346:460-2073(+)